MISKQKDFISRLKKLLYHGVIKIKGKDIDELDIKDLNSYCVLR